MLSSIILLTILSSLLTTEDDISDNENSLKLLHLIIRHGARNPISTYPNDPNYNYVYKEGNGQLTNLGKLQMYTLGKYFRQRYADYITSNPNEIVVQSSALDRTVESGLCHLASLYAPTKEWQFSEDLNWQPIRILTTPLEKDSLLYPGSECPEAITEYIRIQNSPEGEAYKNKFAEFFSYVTNHSGMIVNGWFPASQLFYMLKIEKMNNLIIPDWVTDEVYETLQKIHEDFYYIFSNSTKLQRLRSGPLIGEVLHHMQEKQKGELNDDIKVFAYFTHDINIATFLNTLKIFNSRSPPFCAAILIEYHEFQEFSCVKIFYSNSSNPAIGEQRIHLMTLPDCERECCPLETFANIVHPFIPIDWKSECELQNKNNSETSNIHLSKMRPDNNAFKITFKTDLLL